MAWFDNFLSSVFPEADKTDEGKDRFRAAFFRNMAFFKTLFKQGKRWELPTETLRRGLSGGVLENLVFENAYLAFFNDDVTNDLMLLPVTGVGDMSVYGTFNKYKVVGVGEGYSATLGADKCVIMSNVSPLSDSLASAYPGTPREYLGTIAAQIATAEVTERANVEAQFNPWVLAGAAEDAPTMVNVKNGLKNFRQFIFKRKANDDGQNIITPMHLDVPFIARDLQAYRAERTSEALTYLGYHSLPVDKSERLVVSEVESRDAIAAAMWKAQVDERERACEEVREKLGKTIKFTCERSIHNGGAEHYNGDFRSNEQRRSESGKMENEGVEGV